MNHLGTKRLKTKRLVLRQAVAEDAEAVFRNVTSDDEVTKYLSWNTHESVETTKAFIGYLLQGYERKDFYQWMIEKDGEVIGMFSVVGYHENTAYIGYDLGKAWWHQGIMTETFLRAKEFLFSEVGFEKPIASHHEENLRSGSVMKAVGMTFVRKREGKDNRGRDCFLLEYEIKNPIA